ncbi:MAG TPA: YceI family protein [Candidatus Eisenbacteria bacterium]|jgi:polyisoprenoid-binding protein YceI
MPVRRILALAFALCCFATASPAARRAKAPAAPPPRSLIEGIELYSLDAPHSSVEFVVPWMGISKVHGTFDDIRATIAFDSLDLTRSSVTVVMRAATITTHFERRDKDLKGPDFFDVEKFPFVTFTSREVVQEGDGFRLRGPLTIHGVTHDVEIPFTFNGHIKDAGGDDRIGFEGRLTIKRKDYGIVGPARFNLLLEKGLVIGEDVEIPIAIEGWKPAPRDTMREPVPDSLYRAILARGVAAAARQYRALRAQTPDSLMRVDEGVLNAVGYQLLSKGLTADAIELFQLETEAYPANAFGYSGLGQAYATAGSREPALQALDKAVAIEPAATRALAILRRLRG